MIWLKKNWSNQCEGICAHTVEHDLPDDAKMATKTYSCNRIGTGDKFDTHR